MTDPRHGKDADSISDQLAANPDSPPRAPDDDPRSDLVQAVEARSDAIDHGEGGDGADLPGTVGGTDGVVKNQEGDGQ